jgi:Ca2+-binding EF-hand superfamily protein
MSGLKAKAADADHDGVVTVSELRSFVAKMVETLTHGRQRPTSRQENLEADFAVY